MDDIGVIASVGEDLALGIHGQNGRVVCEGGKIHFHNRLLERLIRPGAVFIMQAAIFQGDDRGELLVGLLQHPIGGVEHAAAEADKQDRCR